MADERRKEWDKITNARRNEKKSICIFNMKKSEDIELYNKFLKIKEFYGASDTDSQVFKKMILKFIEDNNI